MFVFVLLIRMLCFVNSVRSASRQISLQTDRRINENCSSPPLIYRKKINLY